MPLFLMAVAADEAAAVLGTMTRKAQVIIERIFTMTMMPMTPRHLILHALSHALTHWPYPALQIDTRLFSPPCAAALCDLLLGGLVELKRPGGDGVLRLYTGEEE